MYKIEKNIPLTGKATYPFDEMEPGDSFFISVFDEKKIVNIRAHLHKIKQKTGKSISTRREESGLRVWLVKE